VCAASESQLLAKIDSDTQVKLFVQAPWPTVDQYKRTFCPKLIISVEHAAWLQAHMSQLLW